MMRIPVGHWFEVVINWLTNNFSGFFDGVSRCGNGGPFRLQGRLAVPHPLVLVVLFGALAWWLAGRGMGIFTLLGMYLIYNIGYGAPPWRRSHW